MNRFVADERERQEQLEARTRREVYLNVNYQTRCLEKLYKKLQLGPQNSFQPCGGGCGGHLNNNNSSAGKDRKVEKKLRKLKAALRSQLAGETRYSLETHTVLLVFDAEKRPFFYLMARPSSSYPPGLPLFFTMDSSQMGELIFLSEAIYERLLKAFEEEEEGEGEEEESTNRTEERADAGVDLAGDDKAKCPIQQEKECSRKRAGGNNFSFKRPASVPAAAQSSQATKRRHTTAVSTSSSGATADTSSSFSSTSPQSPATVRVTAVVRPLPSSPLKVGEEFLASAAFRSAKAVDDFKCPVANCPDTHKKCNLRDHISMKHWGGHRHHRCIFPGCTVNYRNVWLLNVQNHVAKEHGDRTGRYITQEPARPV